MGAAGVAPASIEIALGGVVVRVRGEADPRASTAVLKALRVPSMIGPFGTTQILVATKPVDFRKQADSLAALVQAALGADPFSGTVYVFRAKRADRVKLIWWDGTGLCPLSKRLEGVSSAGRASRTA